MSDEENPLEGWIQELVATRYRTYGAVARAAGISLSALTRQMRDGSLGLEPLLRLAQATGRSANDVLTLAGKADVAALIESCYGAPRAEDPTIRAIVEVLGQLPRDFSDTHLAYLRSVLKAFRSRAPGETNDAASPAADARKQTRRAARAR